MKKFDKIYNQIISEGLWQNTKNAYRQLTGQGEKDREAAELKRQEELQAKEQEYKQALQDKDDEYTRKLHYKDAEIQLLKNTATSTRFNSTNDANTMFGVKHLTRDQRERETKAFARWLAEYYPKTAATIFYIDYAQIELFKEEVGYYLTLKLKEAEDEGRDAQQKKEREMFS